MINKTAKTILIGTLMIFSSGCAGISSNMSINDYGQVCVSKNSKLNLHDLIKKVSSNSNSNYIFENEYNTYSTSYVDFNESRCFSNINDLKSYVDTYTNYALEINKDRQKSNLLKNEGILLNNIRIKDVFEYLNLVNNSKIKYYDDNIALKDAIKRIYTINELSKYINETTPFILVSAKLEDGNTFYKLSYKDHKTFNKENDVIFNLQKAKEGVEKLNKEELSIKIDEAIEGVKNFN